MNDEIRTFLENLRLTMQLELNEVREREKENKKEIENSKKDIQSLLIRQTVAEQDIKNMQKMLEKINGNTTWILRIVIGAIVMSLLALLFKS